MKHQNLRIVRAWAALLLILTALNVLFRDSDRKVAVVAIPFSQLLEMTDAKRIREVLIHGNSIRGRFSDDREFTTYAPSDASLIDRLYSNGVTIKAVPPDPVAPVLSLLLSWLPLLFVIGVWIGMRRQVGSIWSNPFGFGSSRAKLLTEPQMRITFEDVAGVDEARADLEEIVEFLRNPKRFHELGGRIPRGVLLVGSPGTGKTLIARAVAGEADVPFFITSGSAFEMYVSVGASRVRDMFDRPRRKRPVSSLSMRSTPSAAIAARALVVAAMNANRHSISSLSRWTALRRTTA